MSNQIIKSDNRDGCEVMNSRSLSDVTRGLSKEKKNTFLPSLCKHLTLNQRAGMVANGNSLYVCTYFAIDQFLILIIIGKELHDFIL